MHASRYCGARGVMRNHPPAITVEDVGTSVIVEDYLRVNTLIARNHLGHTQGSLNPPSFIFYPMFVLL